MTTDLSTHRRSRAGGTRLLMQASMLLLLTVALFAQNRPAEPSLQGEGTLKVMTYNMYVGTEYNGLTSQDFDTVLRGGTNMFEEARANDPAGRAQAIARQIADTMPHLVSLQELTTWSTGLTKDSLTVQFDALELLLDALADLGVRYTKLASLTTWDATAPSTDGFVRNTWDVALLARDDMNPEDLFFTDFQAAPWTATLVVRLRALDGRPDLCPEPLRPSDGACRMPMPRGWVSADVSYRGKQFRIVGAHLDHSPFNVLQGLELLNGPANTSLPVIVAADMNADCSDPTDPAYQTCVNLANAGFVDSWGAVNPSEPGYTKTLFPLYDVGADLTQRGDYVMARGPFRVHTAMLVGEERADMTPSGLWPSDHCGVVARLQLAER